MDLLDGINLENVILTTSRKIMSTHFYFYVDQKMFQFLTLISLYVIRVKFVYLDTHNPLCFKAKDS
jgi:hypothetical protein